MARQSELYKPMFRSHPDSRAEINDRLTDRLNPMTDGWNPNNCTHKKAHQTVQASRMGSFDQPGFRYRKRNCEFIAGPVLEVLIFMPVINDIERGSDIWRGKITGFANDATGPEATLCNLQFENAKVELHKAILGGQVKVDEDLLLH